MASLLHSLWSLLGSPNQQPLISSPYSTSSALSKSLSCSFSCPFEKVTTISTSAFLFLLIPTRLYLRIPNQPAQSGSSVSVCNSQSDPTYVIKARISHYLIKFGSKRISGLFPLCVSHCCKKAKLELVFFWAHFIFSSKLHEGNGIIWLNRHIPLLRFFLQEDNNSRIHN